VPELVRNSQGMSVFNVLAAGRFVGDTLSLELGFVDSHDLNLYKGLMKLRAKMNVGCDPVGVHDTCFPGYVDCT
jgi:hypothetical protein